MNPRAITFAGEEEKYPTVIMVRGAFTFLWADPTPPFFPPSKSRTDVVTRTAGDRRERNGQDHNDRETRQEA